MPDKTVFAGFPTVILYDPGDGNQPPAELKAIRQLLWGDDIRVLGESGDFYLVSVRRSKGWIRKSDTQPSRLLDIVFVDIGQGDGALVITPDDRKYVIDAGEGDNMHRFLRWRFGFKQPMVLDAAIVSHSDLDHYAGFQYLFKEKNLTFDTVYHNGIMERNAGKDDDLLGPRSTDSSLTYVSDLVPDLASLKQFLAKPENWKGKGKGRGKQYPTMLADALDRGKFGDFRMLDVTQGYLPGHGSGSGVEVRILGPYPETVGGKPCLRWLTDPGKTKNGHSVVLRFAYRNVSILMGGDLNAQSCRLLMELHSAAGGGGVFACDIAKACHHGTADVYLPFMKAVNPVATVISSGDDEPHAHPRADALGAIGRWGRGDRPLIFSTELSRSAKENVKHPFVLRKGLMELADAYASAPEQKRKKAKENLEKAVAKLDRSIAVYGAINLRTDGERVVMAYKIEQPKPTKEWDVYVLERQMAGGPLAYRSKYDE